jgi:hypothetical protein
MHEPGCGPSDNHCTCESIHDVMVPPIGTATMSISLCRYHFDNGGYELFDRFSRELCEFWKSFEKEIEDANETKDQIPEE